MLTQCIAGYNIRAKITENSSKDCIWEQAPVHYYWECLLRNELPVLLRYSISGEWELLTTPEGICH